MKKDFRNLWLRSVRSGDFIAVQRIKNKKVKYSIHEVQSVTDTTVQVSNSIFSKQDGHNVISRKNRPIKLMQITKEIQEYVKTQTRKRFKIRRLD